MNRHLPLLAVLVLLAAGSAGPARAMTPEDLLELRTVGLADLSPDGRFLLYTLGAWDEEAGRRHATTLRRDLDRGGDRVIFTPEDQAWGPVYSPDGSTVAYLSQGDEGQEIWLMAADGGDRRRVGEPAMVFGALHWSPDGTALAWVAPAPGTDYEGVPERVVVADDLGYRHLDAGYREGRLGQLYVMELGTGRSLQLTIDGLDVRGLDWSPDGARLVFAAKARRDLGRTLNTDLWIVGRTGGAPRRLTRNPGMDQEPRWQADGTICYLRAEDPLWESAPRRVAVIDPETGDLEPPVLHGTAFDDFYWRWTAADGRFYILGSRRGCIDLFAVEGDRHRRLTDGGYDFWDLRVAGSRVVLSGSAQTVPGALYVVDLAEKIKGPHHPRVLVDPNEDWARRVGLTQPEPFAVTVDGRRIEGWFFKPDGLAPGARSPLVLSIHGGPEWMYGGYFLPEFHILPSFGYGVVICNPVGSTGYGVESQRAIRGDWVDRPSREVLACVDHIIAQGWADPDRLAVMGGSYGGHLGAELTTRTDRFRAAALDRMYPETVGFWATTDEKWFPEWEFQGRPWDPGAREVYRRNSPFERVDRVTTPTLISQGLLDFRCLAAGGETWFAALQARGVPARLLRFAEVGHGIDRVSDQVFYYHQLLDWFDRYVLDDPGEPWRGGDLDAAEQESAPRD